MNRFAELLDRLAYEPGRNNKLRLITGYFRDVEDPIAATRSAALTARCRLNTPNRADPRPHRAAHRSRCCSPCRMITSRSVGDGRADVAEGGEQ